MEWRHHCAATAPPTGRRGKGHRAVVLMLTSVEEDGQGREGKYQSAFERGEMAGCVSVERWSGGAACWTSALELLSYNTVIAASASLRLAEAPVGWSRAESAQMDLRTFEWRTSPPPVSSVYQGCPPQPPSPLCVTVNILCFPKHPHHLLTSTTPTTVD